MATEALAHTLQQLTAIATEFLAKHRSLEEEGVVIQDEMEALDRRQEKRAQRIVARLRQASANILAFTDDSSSQEHEQQLREDEYETNNVDDE